MGRHHTKLAPSFRHWNLNCTGHLSVTSCRECMHISPAVCMTGSVRFPEGRRPCNCRVEARASGRRKKAPHSALPFSTLPSVTVQSPWSHSYLPGHAGPWVLGQPDCCVHLNGDRGTSPSSSCWSACSGGLIGSGALGIVCAYCVHREPCPPQLHTPRASGNEESTQRGMLIAFLP